MSFTFHGGRLGAARAAYPDAPAPWLDLSTGINPHPWPGAEGIAIDWRALPDEQALAVLEEAAAAHFGTRPENLCAVPGTEIGLRLVGSMIEGPAVRVGPGYRTHAAMLPGARQIAAGELAEVRGATILLANPNNPDGHVIDPTLLEGLAETPHWLIVDEAFADATPEVSLAGRIGDGRRLVLFRSFGKFFGLAGVRLGFVLGPRELIGQIRDRLGSWPVSSAALAIGTAAYRDRSWIEAMRAQLRAEAAALDAVLLRHGLQPRGACPLFRLARNGDANLFDRLARQGILTRPFDQDPRLLRFGLPGSGLARLDRALG